MTELEREKAQFKDQHVCVCGHRDYRHRAVGYGGGSCDLCHCKKFQGETTLPPILKELKGEK